MCHVADIGTQKWPRWRRGTTLTAAIRWCVWDGVADGNRSEFRNPKDNAQIMPLVNFFIIHFGDPNCFVGP